MTTPIRPGPNGRPRVWCDKCRAVMEHYYHERDGKLPLMPCVPCKLAYMAERYAADPERFKAANHRKKTA